MGILYLASGFSVQVRFYHQDENHQEVRHVHFFSSFTSFMERKGMTSERFLADRTPLRFPIPPYVPNQHLGEPMPYGKQMPAGEARPLGVSRQEFAAKKEGAKKDFEDRKISLDRETQLEVGSQKLSATAIQPTPSVGQHNKEQNYMATLTFKGLNRKGNVAIYSGLKTSVRIALASFADKTAPQELTIDGPFTEGAAQKVKMTAEERKAARAAKPKPTLAERAAAAQKRADALAAKVAAEAAEPQM